MTRRILAMLTAFLALPLPLLAQSQGRGALRPYFYVFLAYGLVWVAIGLWVFLIARRLIRIERRLPGEGESTPEA